MPRNAILSFSPESLSRSVLSAVSCFLPAEGVGESPFLRPSISAFDKSRVSPDGIRYYAAITAYRSFRRVSDAKKKKEEWEGGGGGNASTREWVSILRKGKESGVRGEWRAGCTRQIFARCYRRAVAQSPGLSAANLSVTRVYRWKSGKPATRRLRISVDSTRAFPNPEGEEGVYVVRPALVYSGGIVPIRLFGCCGNFKISAIDAPALCVRVSG